MATFSTIRFGDYLNVTDLGSGVIRVDGCPPGGGGGIQFDTYPQAGNWLYVETDDSTGSPNGWGLELQDQSTGGQGIKIGTTVGEIDIVAQDQLVLWSESNFLFHVAGTWNIDTLGSTVWDADNDVKINIDGDFVIHPMANAESFKIFTPSNAQAIKMRAGEVTAAVNETYGTGNVLFTCVGASGTSTNGKFTVDATGDVLIDGAGDSSLSGTHASLNGGADGTFIGAQRPGGVARISMGLAGDPDGYRFDQVGENYDLFVVGNITIKLQGTGKTLTVLDHSGNPIFRVDEDADLHGKTGKALTFDL